MALTYENVLSIAQKNSLCTLDRLENLTRLAEFVNSNRVKGDFVECGTFKGGSAALLSKFLGSDRHLWLYDSFQGLPAPVPQDGNEAQGWTGKLLASASDVKALMQEVETVDSLYTIKEGNFEQTFLENLPNRVALLHCDADWYHSVLLTLETFYPLIPNGGCVVLDDFGFWEGCREAFYDFCSRHNEKPLLERVGTTQAHWIKGKFHTR
jgi:O-methyltransferase